MSIPVALQSFKSAGVYRVVYDKSTILNQDTQIMRLVIGYSAQGPFNTPVLVRSISEFKALYGEPSKSLEKRGVYFHRLALQALMEGPIICLNLKRFSDETLKGATVDTSFNPVMTPIDVVELKVEDIYDTTRFWELSAFKLAEINDTNGRALDGYISISATNTKNTSATFFLRKASGSKVAGYNVTVNDWYKDSGDEVPEYLQSKLNNKISDFFAEIYIFKGEFNAAQVLASETLKNYFEIKKIDDKDVLVLKPYVTNAYGDAVDTLDALYNDATSGAISHYVGALIPYFKDKTNVYQSLDIKMNADVDNNNLMMNFNVDMLDEGTANIDLSGRVAIPVEDKGDFGIETIYAGTAKTSLLGNEKAPVIADVVTFKSSFTEVKYADNTKRISGNFYVSKVADKEGDAEAIELTLDDLKGVDTELKIVLPKVLKDVEGHVVNEEYYKDILMNKFGIDVIGVNEGEYICAGGCYCKDMDADAFKLPASNITAITNFKNEDGIIKFENRNNYAQAPVGVASNSGQQTPGEAVYGSSVSFVPTGNYNVEEYDGSVALVATDDASLTGFFTAGDCLVAADGTTDGDYDGEVDKADMFYDNVYVQETGNKVLADGTTKYFVKLTGAPITFGGSFIKVKVTENDIEGWVGREFYVPAAEYTVSDEPIQLRDENKNLMDVWVKLTAISGDIADFASYGDEECTVFYAKGKVQKEAEEGAIYVIRIDAPLNQEIGNMVPVYLEGYVYANPKPVSTSMFDKQKWQDFILSTLTDYKGIRTGLLNKSDLDYRYIIDTFETYVTAGAKNILSFLAKEKQSAFAILNFPSVRTFVKCPYTSFTDNKGIFNVEYVVKGYNPKKSHSMGFSLPSESEGASFCAFYTPLKFSDGYIDSLIPSAALVSNLFIEKYRSRQPYYIVAGPNYGAISASGMVGPDYNYSREELNVIEPYGVNCMVYRPGFGTFINANQTAKQTPKSALSSVNVRELVIYLQDEIEKLLQSYQWEFNNQTVRNKIKDKADVICARIQHNGGIQDFVNVMDESNNTPEIIDNEMAILSTHIEPGRGMGKMVHELTMYRTGQMRAAIMEAQA